MLSEQHMSCFQETIQRQGAGT